MAIIVTSRYLTYDPTTPNSAIEDGTVTIKYSAICDSVVAPIITLSALVLSALVMNDVALSALTLNAVALTVVALNATLTAIMTNTARVLIV